MRGALLSSMSVGALSTIIFFLFLNIPGLYGALLAHVVVVIFFAITLGVSRISTNLDPLSTMGIALFSYTTKLFLIGIFLWSLTEFTDRETINRTAFGVTAILLTLAWLGGEIASYMKLRIHLPLPKK